MYPNFSVILEFGFLFLQLRFCSIVSMFIYLGWVMFMYKNGMRYRVPQPSEDIGKDGITLGSDISDKIGKNGPRTLSIKLDRRILTGVEIPYKVTIKKLIGVKLNSQKLIPKIDFSINEKNNTIAFMFNLSPNDLIEIDIDGVV